MPVTGDERLQQLQTALEHSDGLVAAFCRADALSAATRAHLPAPRDPKGHPNKPASPLAINADFQARRAAARRKVLVGLARASSDGALVGVVDSVLLLPELHGSGLGRRCALSALPHSTRLTPRTTHARVPTRQAVERKFSVEHSAGLLCTILGMTFLTRREPVHRATADCSNP